MYVMHACTLYLHGDKTSFIFVVMRSKKILLNGMGDGDWENTVGDINTLMVGLGMATDL